MMPLVGAKHRLVSHDFDSAGSLAAHPLLPDIYWAVSDWLVQVMTRRTHVRGNSVVSVSQQDDTGRIGTAATELRIRRLRRLVLARPSAAA